MNEEKFIFYSNEFRAVKGSSKIHAKISFWEGSFHGCPQDNQERTNKKSLENGLKKWMKVGGTIEIKDEFFTHTCCHKTETLKKKQLTRET